MDCHVTPLRYASRKDGSEAHWPPLSLRTSEANAELVWQSMSFARYHATLQPLNLATVLKPVIPTPLKTPIFSTILLYNR